MEEKTTLEFEFDLKKSGANNKKHGIDFEKAQHLWLDEMRLEVAARVVDELRFLVIGKIDSKCWSAVVTYRETRVRIISVRRARKKELELYESS